MLANLVCVMVVAPEGGAPRVGPQRPPGFHIKNTSKFHENTPREEKKKRKWEAKKKSEIFGGPAEGRPNQHTTNHNTPPTTTPTTTNNTHNNQQHPQQPTTPTTTNNTHNNQQHPQQPTTPTATTNNGNFIDVRFCPILNLGHFGASSLVTHLTFQNVINPKHPNTQTPENARVRACCAVSLCVQPRATLCVLFCVRYSECAVQVCQRFTRAGFFPTLRAWTAHPSLTLLHPKSSRAWVLSLCSRHVARTEHRFAQGWDVTALSLQPHLRPQFGLHVSVRHA